MHSDRSHHSVGLPHSEIRGSQPSYRLLSAYRRFSRPSSPLNAKASIMCPFSLGHAYLTPAGGRCMPRWTLRIQQPATRRTTHADRRLKHSRSFSVQFNLRAPSRCSPDGRVRGMHTCLVRTTNTSLVKEPIRLRDWGSAMVPRSCMPSRGWSRAPAGISADLIIDA